MHFYGNGERIGTPQPHSAVKPWQSKAGRDCGEARRGASENYCEKHRYGMACQGTAPKALAKHFRTRRRKAQAEPISVSLGRATALNGTETQGKTSQWYCMTQTGSAAALIAQSRIGIGSIVGNATAFQSMACLSSAKAWQDTTQH